MLHQIKRAVLTDREWHVYAPAYCGEVMLVGGTYVARPWRRQGHRWPIASFSEINLAADLSCGRGLTSIN